MAAGEPTSVGSLGVNTSVPLEGLRRQQELVKGKTKAKAIYSATYKPRAASSHEADVFIELSLHFF